MGLTFSTIHFKNTEAFSKAYADKVADFIAREAGWEKKTRGEKADVSTVIRFSEGCEWLQISSDILFDEDTAAFCEHLAQNFSTSVSLSFMFDSMSFLTVMFQGGNSEELSLYTGDPEILDSSEPPENRFEGWENYTDDPEKLRKIFDDKITPPYRSYSEFSQLLRFSCSKNRKGNTPKVKSHTYKYGYKLKKENVESIPPVFVARTSYCFQPSYNETHMCSVVNCGRATKGIRYIFGGEEIESGKAKIESATIQMHDDEGNWIYFPLTPERHLCTDGKERIFAELPELPIKEKIHDKMPYRKKSNLEFKQEITLKYKPVDVTPTENYGRRFFKDFRLFVIPLENPEGAYCWIGSQVKEDYLLY